MSKQKKLVKRSSPDDIAGFLQRAQTGLSVHAGGRLIFALDATASRQATWDRACQLQGQMFDATRELAGLQLQLAYYRGLNEFTALPWSGDGRSVAAQMSAVQCRGGYSQIGRVLQHALREHRERPVKALVFVGDAVEERAATLYALAGKLGLQRLPAYLFQEGYDAAASRVFGELARLSGGAHCHFDEHSEAQLRALLTAVARYAAGGKAAVLGLERQSPILGQLIKKLPED